MQYYTDCLIEASSLDYDEVEQRIHKPFYRDIDIQVQQGDVSDLKRDTDWKLMIPLSQTMSDLLQYWVNKLK